MTEVPTDAGEGTKMREKGKGNREIFGRAPMQPVLMFTCTSSRLRDANANLTSCPCVYNVEVCCRYKSRACIFCDRHKV